ncbi:hypothetical protein AB0B85_28740 [Micromonospora sp. NPDC049044]|uniref:hypothetical protein n=1 Tax=unclassified Micromonospora TaxID=2617518 RepID=UPI0033E2E6E3
MPEVFHPSRKRMFLLRCQSLRHGQHEGTTGALARTRYFPRGHGHEPARCHCASLGVAALGTIFFAVAGPGLRVTDFVAASQEFTVVTLGVTIYAFILAFVSI